MPADAYPAVDDLVVAASDPNLAFYNLSVASSSTATLSDNAAVQNNLTVASGGTLVLVDYDLTVEGTIANEGALAETRTVDPANTTFLNIKNSAGTRTNTSASTIDPAAAMGSTTVTV